MRLEKGRISVSQLTFIMAGFMMGSFQLADAVSSLAKQDAWLAVFPGLIEGLLLVFVFISLAKKFPGKTLIEINDAVYGKMVGKILSILYISFFIHIAAANFYYMGGVITIILPETPMLVFIVLIALLCASAIRNGIEIITRCSIILVPIAIAAVLLSFVLLLNKMEINNILPVLDISLRELLTAQHLIACFTFGELVVFLMVIASVKEVEGKDLKRAAFSACFIFAFIILTIIVRNTLSLGNTATVLTRPSFQAVRLIQIAKFFTRMEILVVLNEIIMIFLKISVLYYAVVLGVSQLLNTKSYLPLVLPIGAILVNFSLILYDFNLEYFTFGKEIFPYYSLPFEVIFPVLTLVLANRLEKQKENNT